MPVAQRAAPIPPTAQWRYLLAHLLASLLAARGSSLEFEIAVSEYSRGDLSIPADLRADSGFQNLPEALNNSNWSKKVGEREILKTSRGAFTDHQAQHQAQIETGDVDQESFENVLPASQMRASHSTRFVAMSEWPFQHQTSTTQ